jgi:predicted phage terminase large subunit-like protein
VSVIPLDVNALEVELQRKDAGQSIVEEAHELGQDLGKFLVAGWRVVEPYERYISNWHIDATNAYLTAVSAGEIRKLQVWVPPGSMKSRAVSILLPAWEWCTKPWLRYFGASYDIDLATLLTVLWRNLVSGDWFQARWPISFEKLDERYIRNTIGGSRLATAPGSRGSGHHGHRLLIDDPLNAKETESLTGTKLQEVIDWYDGTLPTRFANPKTGVEVIIMQRLHELDLAAHALQHNPSSWEILCLPERYEPAHPYAWRKERVHPFVGELLLDKTDGLGRSLADGDPRTVELVEELQPDGTTRTVEQGELLWPERVGDAENLERRSRMGRHRAAGQLQQRPAAREGEILKRADFRYYPAEWLEAAEQGDPSHFPPFRRIVLSWDTAFKDKTQNDPVSGGCWALRGADKFRLRSFHGHAGLGKTTREMIAMREWAIELWPNVPVRLVIEKSANGVDIINKLKREIPGVFGPKLDGDKVARAEAAAPDLESHNVFLPGQANGEYTDYDPTMTPDDTQQFVEECSSFPNAAHDDRVDEFSQVIIWLRNNSPREAEAYSAADVQMPTPVSFPR